MENIDVFIIDPDPILGSRLAELIKEDDQTSIAGILQKNYGDPITTELREVNPDVLLLGIDRTDSSEMELFHKLRKEYSSLPIIVMPPHNREGAQIMLTALKSGAVEYINKTQSQTGALHSREHFARWLIPVIKAIPRINKNILVSDIGTDEKLKEMEEISSVHFEKVVPRMELLTIVGCLGGVPALYLLLSSLPKNFPIPVVILQHMPKIFTAELTEDLNRSSSLNVLEAEHGSELHAGQVYVSPGGYHTEINNYKNQNVISLHKEAKVKGYRPSIDVLLKSTRSVFGNRLLVVYLSSGGTDGIEGAKVLDTAGGQIIIQNRNTSLLWDLPFKIDVHGINNGTYPLNRLGNAIAKKLK